MTFNIGNQNAGNINNVGGDQHITGGQTGIMITTETARQAIVDLREVLKIIPLDPATSVEAKAEIDQIETVMRQPVPDRPRIAARLERLTRIFLTAGSLASAGSTLLQPLHTMANWLGGTLGQPILNLLPALT